jgi:SAM-dependent methyltransferase
MAADGWSPVGVELEPAVAARASAQSGLTVLAGSVGNLLGRLAGSFDVVTLWGVLEHVHNPLAELAAATNCLRPGGMLLLETPNSEGLFRTAARGIFHLSHGKLATPYRQLLGAGHIAWFSSAGIRAAAARLDLTVVRLSGSHNDTAALMQRWNGGAAALRLPAMAATAVLNVAGEPIGRPNQLVAALRTRMPPE